MRSLWVRALARYALLCAATALTACPTGNSDRTSSPEIKAINSDAANASAGKKSPVPPLSAEAAPPPTARRSPASDPARLRSQISSFFQGHIGRRFYIQIDKPLYKPGETIWLKIWDLQARSFTEPEPAQKGLLIELKNPQGAAVATRRVQPQAAMAQADFELADGLEGGEYSLQVRSFDGQSAERTLVVSTYEPPRLKMKLEFVRKSYGPGDEVSATIEVKRPTGEPLANHPLSGLIRLDGQDLPRSTLVTSASGAGVLKFALPPEIALGDGLLTVLADDGGVTESIAKRIPILLKKLSVSIFPEGGQLVEGLSGRVYFAAKTPLGKPADVSGRIVDDHGATLARFETVRDGLGRVEFTPSTGRSYHVEIDKPLGILEHYALPLSAPTGCVLRSFDDLDGELPALRVSVRCTETRQVTVAAVLRENFLDAATVQVERGKPAIVYLEPKNQAEGDDTKALARLQGAARVTVFDEQLNPLAERLVYRNRRARLNIRVVPNKVGPGFAYSPRDQVTLSISTRSPQGKPQPAELALSVVDDTVLSFADDKTGHMLSRLYLEPEFPDKVPEPNFYFDLTEAKSALALDLLMGTSGWRKFEWQPVLNPPPPISTPTPAALAEPEGQVLAGGDFGGLRKGMAPGIGPGPLPAQKALRPALPAPAPADEKANLRPAKDAEIAKREVAAEALANRRLLLADSKSPPRAKAAAERPALPPALAAMPPPPLPIVAAPVKQMIAEPALRRPPPLAQPQMLPAGELARAAPEPALVPVRVFPAPIYRGDYSGPRTDFRETIAWLPTVQTGKDGNATVTFYLSDAVTSFRVIAEGVGGGAAGRDETVLKSKLPFSLAVKLPVEVSAKDKIRLPLMLTNECNRALKVELEAHFGDLLALDRPVERTSGSLAPAARDALYYPLTVAGRQGQTAVRFAASADGLRDEFVRELRISPLGFPQQVGQSGQVLGQWSAELDLGDAMLDALDGTLKLYPTPVASLLSGLDGMLQQPCGCFEQASSSNYPNVMILRALKQQAIADPLLIERATRLIDDGYKRLIGFETKEKGYEWFGAVPGHEALSAYGLAQFVDMKEIYDVDGEMLARTAAWLRDRRDGHGGYLRDAKALDSFGAASAAVTDAYITYSLTEAHQNDLDKEIDGAARLASETQDAYLLALYANILLNSGRQPAGQMAVQRLSAMQDENGAYTKANHSITRSSGLNLHVETTALAAMALIKAGGFEDKVRRAMEWLLSHRGGFGAWGATQATVLALKAITAYAAASARMDTGGEVALHINGQRLGEIRYEAGHREPLLFSSLGQFLKPGKNRIELRASSQAPLPFTLGVQYRALTPAKSLEAKIALTTELERPQAKMGESVRLNVTVTNKSDKGQPMTLVRVGIPGGTSFQTWQLKELRDKGLIAFYETKPREVILYLREMKPSEELKLPIDLLAVVPGEYLAPASSAYLYYSDEHKTWVEGTRIRIDP